MIFFCSSQQSRLLEKSKKRIELELQWKSGIRFEFSTQNDYSVIECEVYYNYNNTKDPDSYKWPDLTDIVPLCIYKE